MTEDKYNGWTNYETWCVKLWIDNDQGLYETAQEICCGHRSERYGLAGREDDLQGYLGNLMPRLEASFASDLLGHAFYRVNWREIVETIREDHEE